MGEQTEAREIAARRAYDAWRRHYDHVTRWNELSPGAQVLWLNVAQAAESVRKDQLDLLDWADLREAARTAGWTRTAKSGQYGVIWWSNWKYLAPDERGQVSITYYSIDGWGFTIVNRPDSVSLQDPTPAKVLTAVRLVGLVGAS
jgi:hypothetical protein